MKVVIAAAVALAIMLAACGDDDASPTASPTETAAPSPSGPTPAPSGSPRTPEPTVIETICQDNPDAATSGELRVSSPGVGGTLVSPANILGTVGVVDSTYAARLFADDGTQIADSGQIQVTGATPLQIQIALTFAIDSPVSACLWVFKLGGDGSPENIVQVPVRLALDNDPGVCLPNPEPPSPDVLEIAAPQSGESISSPLTASGEIVALEGEFRVTLYNAGGEEIADIEATSDATEPGEKVPFRVDLPFEVTQETPACLWVWESSAAGGQAKNVGQVPVTLLP